MTDKKPFLTADWRWLVMLNYEVDPRVLDPYVPLGTELDTWNGRTYASMVGLLFEDTRLLGLSIPFHSNFEEVNLRFYVRRRERDSLKRGVVFIKEIVPRRAIAWVARLIYGEKYSAMPVRHSIELEGGKLRRNGEVEYAWRRSERWNYLGACTQGQPDLAQPESLEEFITEHYWGYSSLKNGGCIEYQVEHPPWRVWQVSQPYLDCDIASLYGPVFKESLEARPSSAFVAEGSHVRIYPGRNLKEK
jgi:uncharacterized protein